jgi:pimeloyl-ACP methyl ester carboxylesterase
MTTILFVPGAWITKAFYEPFLQALTIAGYDVRYGGYPSLDPKDPSTTDCHADTEAIAAVLRPLLDDEGKDVLLFMHSYAGMPGAAAATGLAKSQRAQEGKVGGVIGLLFLGAFVVPEGLSCAGLQGGNLPHWILLDQVGGPFLLLS